MKKLNKEYIFKNIFYYLSGIIIIFLYIVSLIRGFRWPSSWVMTNHLITGFIPRALAGNIIKLFLGINLYKKQVLYTIILITSCIFIIYIIFNIIKLVCKKKNLLCLFIFFVFAISPYAKYFLHESGYFEQYGYILGIILIEIALKKNSKITSILAIIFAAISVGISETNLFLVVPFLFVISIIKILKEDTNAIKKSVLLIIGFIPIIIYSLLAFQILQPSKENIVSLYEEGQKYVNFDVREDTYYYAYGDRTNQQEWKRTLHPIPYQAVVYPLALVFIVAFYLYKSNKKIAIIYAVLSILVGIFNYSIVILAWDLDRYYFCIFMQIFIISLYVIKEFLTDYKVLKKDYILLIIFLVMCLFICNYEFYLFDGATYLRNINDVVIELNNY